MALIFLFLTLSLSLCPLLARTDTMTSIYQVLGKTELDSQGLVVRHPGETIPPVWEICPSLDPRTRGD